MLAIPKRTGWFPIYADGQIDPLPARVLSGRWSFSRQGWVCGTRHPHHTRGPRYGPSPVAGKGKLGVCARCLRSRWPLGASDGVAVLEGGGDGVGVRRVAGFDHEFEFGGLDGGGVEEALVDDLDNVAAGGADDGGDVGQDAGAVGDVHGEAEEAAVAEEAAEEDVGEDAAVDVAAADDGGDAFAGEAGGVGEEGGDADGSGAFGDLLGAFGEEGDGVFDDAFGDDEDFLDVAAERF